MEQWVQPTTSRNHKDTNLIGIRKPNTRHSFLSFTGIWNYSINFISWQIGTHHHDNKHTQLQFWKLDNSFLWATKLSSWNWTLSSKFSLHKAGTGPHTISSLKFSAIWGTQSKIHAIWGTQYQILRHLGLTIPNFTPPGANNTNIFTPSGAHNTKIHAIWGTQYKNFPPSGANLWKF